MLASHRGEIPFFVLLLPFTAGIVLGIYFAPAIGMLWAALSGSAVLFIILNFTYNRFGLHRNRWIGGLLIMAILLLSGWIRIIQSNELRAADHFSHLQAKYLTVRINNEPQQKNGYLHFTCQVIQTEANGHRHAATGSLLVMLKDTSQNLRYGDELLIPSTYKPIDPPFNPAEFNYKNYLANKNIFYQEFLYPGQFHLLQSGTGNPIIAFSLHLRQQLVGKLKQNLPDTNAAAVASALILGYKANLNNDVRQTYADTGTIHVLSVSGAHVAAIYGLLLLAFGFFDRFRYGKLIKSILIIGLIWSYAMLTGFSPSVCRAATMISVVIAGKTFRRHSNTLNTLAASAFVMLLYNPLYITDAGFQLSYLAIFGIVVFQPIIYRWFTFKRQWVSKLWTICSVSIAAQIVVFPLSAFYFHQFPVYFLISNLIIVIPVIIIIYAGVAFLLLPHIPFLSKALAYTMEKSIQQMTGCLNFIGHIPFANIRKIWLNVPEYLLCYALIIGLFYFIYSKKIRWLWFSLISLLAFSLICSTQKLILLNSRNIVWLNLGKHQGMIFRNGMDAIMLTDLNRNDRTYQYRIQPYLDSCGVEHTSLYQPQQPLSTSWMKKKSGLIQFFNTRIFIFDKRQNNNLHFPRIKVDYIYLSGDPYGNAAFAAEKVDRPKVILDGTNSDQYIDSKIGLLKKYHIKYYILKRNKSLTSISK